MHIIDLEALGMPGDDSSAANQGARDCSPVWNSTMPGVKEGDTLLLPPRYCAFKSPIIPLPNGVKLLGQGSGSHMVRCFSQSPGEFFLTTGVSDSWVEGVRIWTADGASGGNAIGRHATSPDDAPYHTVLKNIEITRFTSGRWSNGVWIDGTLGTPMYGARRAQFENLIVSGCDDIGMWLGGMNSASGTNIILGAGGPTWALWLYGTASNPSAQIKLDGPIDGTILMYATLTTRVEAASVEWVIMDGNCVSSEVEASYMNHEPPVLLGQNLTVRANGKTWRSSQNGTITA